MGGVNSMGKTYFGDGEDYTEIALSAYLTQKTGRDKAECLRALHNNDYDVRRALTALGLPNVVDSAVERTSQRTLGLTPGPVGQALGGSLGVTGGMLAGAGSLAMSLARNDPAKEGFENVAKSAGGAFTG